MQENKSCPKEVNEVVRIPSKVGNIVDVYLNWRGKYYSIKIFFPFSKLPNRNMIQDQIAKIYPNCKVLNYRVSNEKTDDLLLQVTEDNIDVEKKEKIKKEDFTNWKDDYTPTEIETTDIIKPEPLKPTRGIGSNMISEKIYNNIKKSLKSYKKSKSS